MFSRQQKAFTLIELMIVMTIISIIACIAVPAFLSARLTANETAAVAGVQSVIEAQSIFKRTDYYGHGSLCYALAIDDLCVLPNTQPALIDKRLALSRPAGNWWDINPEPYAGYFLQEIVQYGNTLVYITVNGNRVPQRFGVIAAPAGYMVTGRQMFAGDDNGRVWRTDPLGDYNLDAQTLALYDTADMAANGWLPYE